MRRTMDPMALTPESVMDEVQPAAQERAQRIQEAVRAYATATSQQARPELYGPLAFLLAQVRESLAVDVVFVSQFVDRERVFEVVSAEGEAASRLRPGTSDPLLDTYCQRIVDGRLPAVIADTTALPEAAGRWPRPWPRA